jgi:hypothetical protein
MAFTYPDRVLDSMESRYSVLQPIQPGDVCCSCGRDCDGEGFAHTLGTALSYAYRVFGHPICGRLSCYQARWDEFKNQRSGCGCGLRHAIR